MPQIVSIHRVAKRDAPAESLQEAPFRTDFGLEGDWRSRQGRGRQITMIEAEALERVAGTLGMAQIPAGASRRQVVVTGVRLNDLIGKRLRAGTVLIEVAERCDPCPNMEVKIGAGAQQAMAGRGGICGRVIEGGVLRPGDRIEVVV